MFSLRIEKQDYSQYSLVSKDTDKIITFNDPGKIIGVFHNQTIHLVDDQFNIKTPIVTPKNIVGEIELYSKYSFKPSKKGVPAYIFTPINKMYPKCIVHSKIKSKYKTNVIITVDYTNYWRN